MGILDEQEWRLGAGRLLLDEYLDHVFQLVHSVEAVLVAEFTQYRFKQGLCIDAFAVDDRDRQLVGPLFCVLLNNRGFAGKVGSLEKTEACVVAAGLVEILEGFFLPRIAAEDLRSSP